MLQGGNRREKLLKICKYTLDKFLDGRRKRFRMGDLNLRTWAKRASKEEGLQDFKGLYHHT